MFGADFWAGAAGPFALAVLVAGCTAALLSRPVRRIGVTAWGWVLCWTLYLLAVFFPQSSTFRLLLPVAPLGGALASVRSSTVVAGVLGVSVALQGLWLYCCFGGWQFFWSVP